MSLGLFGIQAKRVTSHRRQSSLQRFYRSSDLALLRNESKMAKMALSRQPSGDPTAALLSGGPSVGTVATKISNALGQWGKNTSRSPLFQSTGQY